MTHFIRLVHYTGDFDSTAEVHVAGPFATEQDRDNAIYRLYGLPGAHLDFDFESTSLDPAAAEKDAVLTAEQLTAEQLAAVSTLEDLRSILSLVHSPA